MLTRWWNAFGSSTSYFYCLFIAHDFAIKSWIYTNICFIAWFLWDRVFLFKLLEKHYASAYTYVLIQHLVEYPWRYSDPAQALPYTSVLACSKFISPCYIVKELLPIVCISHIIFYGTSKLLLAQSIIFRMMSAVYSVLRRSNIPTYFRIDSFMSVRVIFPFIFARALSWYQDNGKFAPIESVKTTSI